ncbi:hypothetical protein CYMTET_8928, partial [Cymbomonas tetramitiformis]
MSSLLATAWQCDATFHTFMAVNARKAPSDIPIYEISKVAVAEFPGGRPRGPPPAPDPIPPSAQLRSCTVADFELVWRPPNEHDSSPKISMWRARAPEGYYSLGDCLSQAHLPPVSTLVFREAGKECVLLAPPIGFEQVWKDKDSAGGTVSFWRPVPPVGYVAMGHLVSGGHERPPFSSVRCLHHRLASAYTDPDNPNAFLCRWTEKDAVALRSGLPVSVWGADTMLHTFISSSSHEVPEGELWNLDGNLDKQEEDAPAREVTEVNAELSVPDVSITLYDDGVTMRNPLVDFTITSLASYITGTTGQMQVAGQVTVAAEVLNPRLSCWEPLVEPFMLRLSADHNQVIGADGRPPGAHLHLQTESEVNLTFSPSGAEALYIILGDFLPALRREAGLSAAVVAPPGSASVLHNVTGDNACLQRVTGNQSVTSVIRHTQQTIIQLPSSVRPRKRRDILNSFASHQFLSVTVDSACIQLGQTPLGHCLACCVWLQESPAEDSSELWLDPRALKVMTHTVAMEAVAVEDGMDAEFMWRQTLLLEVPRFKGSTSRLRMRRSLFCALK